MDGIHFRRFSSVVSAIRAGFRYVRSFDRDGQAAGQIWEFAGVKATVYIG